MVLWFWKIGWKKERGAEPPAPVVEGDYPLDLTAQVINSGFQKELVIPDPDLEPYQRSPDTGRNKQISW